MLGRVARGAYVLVVATMVIVWVFSLNRSDPAQAPSQAQIWYIQA